MFTYFSLVYSDGLHLVEKRNLRLGKSILKATDSNGNANPLKYAVCFNLNECDFPELPSPATRCKLLYSPVKCVGPVCKPIRRVFKFLLKVMDLFVQLSYLFVLYPSQFLTVHSVNLLLPLRHVCVQLELQLQPLARIYQTFATLTLWFDLFLQNLKLPPLLSLLFLLIKNIHLLPLLSLLTHQILKVLVLLLLQHFLFHHTFHFINKNFTVLCCTCAAFYFYF